MQKAYFREYIPAIKTSQNLLSAAILSVKECEDLNLSSPYKLEGNKCKFYFQRHIRINFPIYSEINLEFFNTFSVQQCYKFMFEECFSSYSKES